MYIWGVYTNGDVVSSVVRGSEHLYFGALVD
jgi:hypothetical protein